MPLRSGVALAISLTGAAVAATSAVLGGGADAFDRIEREGVIRIGYAVEAPYALVASGRVTGESPELARLVVERMGIDEIEWVQSDFDALASDLRDGRFDVIAAGMFITRERSRAVGFSEPTLRVRPGLLVQRGNRHGLGSFKDVVARTDIRVAAIAGSFEEERLLASGFPPENLLHLPDAVSGRAAVAHGAVDVLVLSEPTTREMARYDPGRLESVEPPSNATDPGAPVSYVGFGFRREDERLVAAWNAAQAEIVGSAAHLRAIRPFGFGRSDLPVGARLDGILKTSPEDGASRGD